MLDARFDLMVRGFSSRCCRRGALTALVGVVSGLAVSPLRAGVEEQRRRCRTEKERRVRRAVRDASRRYNQKYRSMLCVAKCESSLDNCAVDPTRSYYGLYQFLPSTFDSTPFGRKDIFDPKWNAMAAGWMWKKGRQNEWACCDGRYGCNCPKR
jgi:hypothetical protein